MSSQVLEAQLVQNSLSKPRKSSVIRKSTVKPRAIQSAIAIKRANGQSKLQIAKDLDISPNTVTNILALNSVEEQIAKARRDAVELAPIAITAIKTDLQAPGGGNLGLRLLNDIGAIGEDAIDTIRRNSARSVGAINVLVQAGGTVELHELHNNAAEASTDTTAQITQVVESKHDKQ